MGDDAAPAKGALAGARAWGGAKHELAAAAVVATHILAEQSLTWLDLPVDSAVPLDMELQVDAPVDDVGFRLRGGGRAWVQARRTLSTDGSGPTAIAAVVAQWSALDAQSPLDPARDRVVGVAERFKGYAEIAATVLQKRRLPMRGAWTAGEAKQLKALTTAVTPPADAGRVLDSAVLHRISALAPQGGDRRAAIHLLELRVVEDGCGDATFALLESALADVARLRGGLDYAALREIIVAGGMSLRCTRPRHAAALHAAAAHRARLSRSAATLTFAGLQAGMPAVSRSEADAGVRAVNVTREFGDDIPVGDDPRLLQRRYGRVLLCGLPGAGKSTALSDIAGAMASDADAPLPLLVSARALHDALATSAPREALLACAATGATGDERADLAAAFAGALDQGSAALLVDALDEADGAPDVLRALIDILDELPASTEAIVATRDVLFADAERITRWPAIRLLPPLHPEILAREVLRAAAATARPVDEENWLEARVEWVRDRLATESYIGQTPLLVTLMSQLRAVRDDAALPETAAELLREATWSLIERWETGKPDDRMHIGGLTGTLARSALRESFAVIGARLVAGATCQQAVTAELAEHLNSVLGTLPLAAEAIAEDALRFWDRCGVYVIDQASDQIVPAARQLAELGAALRAAELTAADAAAWTEAHLQPGDAEALRLAASLSTSVREAAYRAASRVGDVDLLLRAARLDPPLEAPAQAIAALADALATQARLGGERALELAAAAADIASTPMVVAMIDKWTKPRQRTMLRARLALGSGAHDLIALRELAQLEDVERPDEGDIFAMLGPDVEYSATFVRAGEWLLDEDPDAVPLLLQRLTNLSIADGGRLASRLEQAGYGAEVAEALQGEDSETGDGAEPTLDAIAAMHACKRTFMDWLATLAEPAELPPREERSLTTLARLWRALQVHHAPAFEPAGILMRHAHVLREVIMLAARLSGEEAAVISAEARLVRDAWTGDEPPLEMELVELKDQTDRVPLERWDRVADVDAARETLIEALALGRWLPRLSQSMLLTMERDPQTIDELRARLPVLESARRRWHLALTLCWWRRSVSMVDGLLREQDPAIRRGAAEFVAFLARFQSFAQQVACVLDDPDDGVRAAFVQRLRHDQSHAVVIQAVMAADWSPRPWRCVWCEQANDRNTRSCTSCRIIDAETGRAVAALTRAG